MTHSAIVEALAGLPPEYAHALEPILRIMSHDLNGAMTPLTLEASALEELAERLQVTTGSTLPVGVDAAEVREIVSEASTYLRHTADRVSGYLAEARRVVEHARESDLPRR